jgi:hypothetical protein
MPGLLSAAEIGDARALHDTPDSGGGAAQRFGATGVG